MIKKNIYIISAGCGNKEYLTLKAVRTVEKMDYLIGPERFKDFFPQKKYIITKKVVEHTVKIIENDVENLIGVIVSGDAGFFSLAKILYKKFSGRIAEVVPGISSMQAAMAKLCKSYENMEFFSIHGRDNDTLELLKEKISFCLNFNHNLYILCDNSNSALEILKKNIYLIDKFRVFVVNDVGMDTEKIVEVVSLERIEQESLNLHALYLEVK
ncbi:precorrin-6y C5,15-methyltransferase (decarboxylating) subunit CbiE [Deferribacter abyssi]|uniref:precorrin-6y C5,15-methyltransferase (decarboxylating) subunit CbiE n=1 Tax=Deferribacter abyssi TaxID=213806 RepID=UPI003C24FC78